MTNLVVSIGPTVGVRAKKKGDQWCCPTSECGSYLLCEECVDGKPTGKLLCENCGASFAPDEDGGYTARVGVARSCCCHCTHN